jgi:hypothetical protein
LRWAIIVSFLSALLKQNVQPFTRSAKEILHDIESQVKLTCLGVAQNVQSQQTKNGIKDAYMQHWIDNLITRARTLHKEHPERTAADIQKELLAWVAEHKSNIFNPFLSLEDMFSTLEIVLKLNFGILQGLILLLIRLLSQIPMAWISYPMECLSKADIFNSFAIN